MIKVYRNVHHWDQWLCHFLGRSVLDTEKDFLSEIFAKRYGKHALLIGSPEQKVLLNALVTARHVLLSPMIRKCPTIHWVESGYDELPIASGSVDRVILPHTLELLDNPRKLLSEACRIVKPEGDIVIFGFNPHSCWGLKRHWVRQKKTPWSSHFISPGNIKTWLSLEDFQLVRQDGLMFRPPLRHQHLFNRLKWVEWAAKKMKLPFAGIYVIQAKAKVIPLTPIKLRWKQQISPLKVTLPGPTMRDIR